MYRVIIVGSPRADGRSAHLADEIFNTCIEEYPEDGAAVVSVASVDVLPCTGCDACRDPLAVSDAPGGTDDADDAEVSGASAQDDELVPHVVVASSDAALHQCAIDDDMFEVRRHLDAADELIVVAPVYFSGPAAQFAALLDRMQPYYWSNVRQRAQMSAPRPMTLHVVGEGGDPHGFEPLVGIVRSALAVAGFRLERICDWTGKISPAGEILAEADEQLVAPDDEEPARRADAAGKADRDGTAAPDEAGDAHA